MPASTPSLERHHWLAAALVGLGIAMSACTTFSDLAIGAGGSNVVNPNGKTTGSTCTTGDDCQSGSCSAGTCGALSSAQTTDGKKDGNETDVDCGGGTAPQCADGKTCAASTDCTSATCNKSNVCAQPSPTDGVKNADETDIDCGGAAAPKCATDKTCAADTDCTDGVCSYAKKCLAATAKSCAQQRGGDTCGAGETGAADAKHESCCTTVKADNGISYGKYQITAGRFRAFATHFGGNLKAWAATNPPGWDDSFTSSLPGSMADVNGSLGPNTKRGCQTSQSGARTWYQPDISASERNTLPQDTLDEKTLNCFPWYLAQALCNYDGGRLPTGSEIASMVTNDEGDTYPWNFQDNTSYNIASTTPDPRIVHHYSYATPDPGTDVKDGSGLYADRSFYIAPPGRRPTGANKFGVMDAVGNMLMWVGDGYNKFVYTASWEDHPVQLSVTSWSSSTGVSSDEMDGYYGIGGRCVFDN